MKTWVAASLAAAGVAALAFAGWSATGGHLFDGCVVHLESSAPSPVGYRVELRGEPHDGTLFPGDAREVKVCTFAPRDAPDARVEADGRGALDVTLDPFCSAPRIIVNATALYAEARTCE